MTIPEHHRYFDVEEDDEEHFHCSCGFSTEYEDDWKRHQNTFLEAPAHPTPVEETSERHSGCTISHIGQGDSTKFFYTCTTCGFVTVDYLGLLQHQRGETPKVAVEPTPRLLTIRVKWDADDSEYIASAGVSRGIRVCARGGSIDHALVELKHRLEETVLVDEHHLCFPSNFDMFPFKATVEYTLDG